MAGTKGERIELISTLRLVVWLLLLPFWLPSFGLKPEEKPLRLRRKKTSGYLPNYALEFYRFILKSFPLRFCSPKMGSLLPPPLQNTARHEMVWDFRGFFASRFE